MSRDAIVSSLFDSTRKGVKVGAPRQAAYDNAECVVICRAMLAARNCDTVSGAWQKRHDFHLFFLQKYKTMARTDFPKRSAQSLLDKFNDIRADSGKFRGILDNIRQKRRYRNETTQEIDPDDATKVCCSLFLF